MGKRHDFQSGKSYAHFFVFLFPRLGIEGKTCRSARHIIAIHEYVFSFRISVAIRDGRVGHELFYCTLCCELVEAHIVSRAHHWK